MTANTTKAMYTYKEKPLLPVGTYAEKPSNANGKHQIGQLLIDVDGGFWAQCVDEMGAEWHFAVSDRWAAVHCTSIGTAPELRRAA